MAFDFDKAFQVALGAGLKAAQPGGTAAQDWVRESALANMSTLLAIAKGVEKGAISRDSAAMLIRENERALDSEAAALAVIVRATVQSAINAFLKSLGEALSVALKIPL